MERSNEILGNPVIHSCLAADAGVDLSEKRGRNLNYRYAPHVDRRDEAGHVADDAPAKGDHG